MEKKKQANWFGWIMGIFLIVGVIGFQIAWEKLTTAPSGCTQDIITITGIKDASAGGILTSSKCVYTTDKGDRVFTCAFQTGDKINEGWHC